jgi:hypothetical protein
MNKIFSVIPSSQHQEGSKEIKTVAGDESKFFSHHPQHQMGLKK